MELESQAVRPGEAIPVRYTRDGENVSPPLRWTGVPEDARELVLFLEQTTKPFVHWIIYGIPPERDDLPEGIRHRERPDEVPGAAQGTNGIGNVGYDGPQGTAGRTVRYVFRLHALDRPLDAPPGLDADAVRRAMDRHVLAEAELPFTFERPR